MAFERMPPQITPHPKAPKQLVLNNLRLIWYVIGKRYNWYGDRNDLVYAGYCGLTKAAANYDPNRGSFSTLAVFYISIHIKKYIIIEQENTQPPFDERFYRIDREDPYILKELLQKTLLTGRERDIIQLHDLEGLLLKDLTVIFGISIERVSKIRRMALKKIKKNLSDRSLRCPSPLTVF